MRAPKGSEAQRCRLWPLADLLTETIAMPRISRADRRRSISAIYAHADVARNARGYVLTGDDVKKAGRWSHSRDPYLLETSAAGMFACGDVRLSPVKRVASAVGEGSMAVAFVHQYLAHDGQSRSSRA